MAYTSPFDVQDDDPEFQAFKAQFLGGDTGQQPGFKSAFKNALGSQVQGAGQIAADLGWQDNPIERYGKSVQDANPMSIRSLGDIVESPWQATKEGTGMALGYIAPAMLGRGLQVAGGAMKLAGLSKAGVALNTLPAQAPLAAVPSYGGIREEQEAGGHNDLADIGMAALGAGTVGAIETKFGAQKMLGLGKGAVAAPTRAELVKGLGKTPLATMGKVMGRTVAEEMGEELAQNPIEQLASYQNPLTAENINETLTGSALAGLGTIGLGGAGGARMAMRHKGINDFRQQDLLNNPSASIGTLSDQGQWDREFMARDEGQAAADQWYTDHMNQVNDARLGGLTTWNEPLADYQARLAAAGNPFMGNGPSVDLLNDSLGIDRNPVKQHYAAAYNQKLETPIVVPDDSGNPITISTVGEAYDYKHGVGKFAPQAAKVDALGYPLSPYQPVQATQQQSAAPSWERFGIEPTQGGANVIPQVAQGSNQAPRGNTGGSAGNTSDQPGVGRGRDNVAGTPVGRGGENQLVGSTSGGVGAVNSLINATPVGDSQVVVNAGGKRVSRNSSAYLQHAVDSLFEKGSDNHVDLSNLIAEAGGYKNALKKLITHSMDGLKIALSSASEKDSAIVRAALGWDNENHQVAETRPTLDEIGKQFGYKPNKDGRYAAGPEAVLKKFGITNAVLDKMWVANLPTVSASELLPTQGADGEVSNFGDAGFSTSDSIAATHVNEHASAKMSDEERAIAQRNVADTKAADEAIVNGLVEEDPRKLAKMESERLAIAEQSRKADKYVEANRKRGAEVGMRELIRDAANSPHLEAARADWSELKGSNDPDFNDLHPRDAVSWIIRYGSIVDKHDGSFNELWVKLENAQREAVRVLEKDDGRTGIEAEERRELPRSVSVAEEGGSGAEEVRQLETEEVVQPSRSESASEEVTAEGVVSRWNQGAQALGVTTWDGLSSEQQNYILGSGTWEEFDEAAGEVLDEINDDQGAAKFSEADKQPTNEQIDAWENGMLTLDEFMPTRFPAVGSAEISYPGPGGRFTPKAIRGAAFYRETNGEGLFDLLAYDKQYNFNRTYVATKPEIALGQGGNTGINVVFRSKSLSGTENVKPGTGKIAGREYVTEVIAPRAVVEVKMSPVAEKGLRPLVRRVLASEFNRTVEDGQILFTRKIVYSRQSAGFSEAKTDQGVDPQKLSTTLRKLFFSPEKFNKLVSIYPDAASIPLDVKEAAAADAHMSVKDVPWEQVQGFAMNGKVYLVAGNIKEGNELGVFLHEMGVHVGMEKLIGKANMQRLSSQIEQWAANDNGSRESKLAKDAVRRAEGSASKDRQQEVIAYFVEEAVKSGINPVAIQKTNSPLAQWFRSLWAAAKLALRKIGFGRFDQLTAQNIVDLSYGAAKMELTGTWHGTAADFRNFNHSYMGSGEGAQAFGWGTYLAQRPGIAKEYWKDDVRRKTAQGVPELANFKAGDTVKGTGTDWDGAKIVDTRPGAVKINIFGRDAWVSTNAPTQPEGSLMRVDIAVHDDEMLDWNKPLSEQNKVRIALMPVRKEIGGNLSELTDIPWNEMDGLNLIGNIYERGVLVRALEEGYVLPKDAATEEALREGDAYRATSLYLDSIGIKSIKFLDSQSRDIMSVEAAQAELEKRQNLLKYKEAELAGAKATYTHKPDSFVITSLENSVEAARRKVAAAEKQLEEAKAGPTRNLVIFNDKNIQRVATQVGADRERIKFSQADVTRINPQYRQTSTLVKQVLEYVGNKFQSVENNLMFGHQLAEKLQRLMPGTDSYIKSLQKRQTERVKHEQEIARIASAYNELDTKQQNALNAFVQKSTMDGKWGFKPTWFEKDVQTAVDATMKTQFDALTPAAQQIVKDMFKFGSEQQKRFDESVNANITDPKKKVQRNQMYGKPYAPLKRFGDHVVVGKSAAFVAEEKANPGSKRLAEMKADPKHYYVEFTDGNWEAIKRRDEMASANPALSWLSKPLQLEDGDLVGMNFTMLEKLKRQIEASDSKSSKATKSALSSLANQLYIQQLNHLHANKSQAQRLNVKGADTDMMRAFVTQGRAEAALIANLRTHAETEKALQQIQTAAREGSNQDAKTRVANAVLRRHLAMLDFKPTPIQNKLMGANSFMMLLTSPAYYLTNATQPFVVSLPYMAGRFGGANSWNTLRDAYKTTLELVKLPTLFKDQNLDTAHLRKFNSIGREADALQTLLDENLVNVGMEMELGDIANQSKNPAWKHVQKGMQVLKTGVANVEILNRLSSAVAGYRLAYTEAINKGQSTDAAHDAGVEYARKLVIDTHGDYAGYNAPTIMMQGAFGNLPVKLMTQFKKFQFIQAGLLIGTFRDAYLRGNLNPTEKAVAKAMFKWMLGTQAALAGALGGVTGVPMALLGSILAGAFGDDGEDKEAFLRRVLGGGAFAQLILHGAPAAAGVDISKRVGMGAALDPFRMADPQTDWSDYALSLAGPSAGLASRTANGLSYMGKGQYWKGLEMLMPSGVLTNASKIARYESEGLTNSRGDVVMKPEEISLMTDIMQGMGLETTQLSDRRWKAGAVYDRGIHFKEQTAKLQRDYVEAIKDGDQGEVSEIRQKWMKLQAERVKQGFKRENMTALTQAPMAQKKRERDTINGLQSTQTNKKFVESIDAL